METVKNYLESMFRNLPNTPEVLKAKQELLQMMEDKYIELMREGKTENEAVGTIISEFGNLDEVAESLGIEEIIAQKPSENTKSVTFDDIKEYFSTKLKSIVLRGIGIALFLCCVVPPIIFDNWLGAALMFIFIALGVGLCICSGNMLDSWRFLTNQPCSISSETADYVTNEKRNFKRRYSIYLSVGIACFICSVVPSIILDELFYCKIDFSGALFFMFIAVGVFLVTYAKSRYAMYQKILTLNDVATIGGSYVESKDKQPEYTNKNIKVIMSVYWPTVTCLYLCISFLTFAWHITWLIWPIAGVVSSIINAVYTKE